MVPWRATEEGFVTPEVLDWYGRFAAGQPGGHRGRGDRHPRRAERSACCASDTIASCRACAIARRGWCARRAAAHTRLLIQLIDFLAIRRRPEPTTLSSGSSSGDHRAAPRVPRHAGGRGSRGARAAAGAAARGLEEVLERTRARGAAHGLPRAGDRRRARRTCARCPQTLPPLFASAAVRARAAGFDGVELHYAHAYTMASFLSATNTRTDGYGGAPAQRVRLPLEVFAVVRAAVGGDYPVGCRILADECIDGRHRHRHRRLLRLRVRARRHGLHLALARRQVR